TLSCQTNKTGSPRFPNNKGGFMERGAAHKQRPFLLAWHGRPARVSSPSTQLENHLASCRRGTGVPPVSPLPALNFENYLGILPTWHGRPARVSSPSTQLENHL